MRVTVISVFLAVVVVSDCHIGVPKKCCFDEELEGYYGASVGSVQDGHVQGITQLLQFAYDFKGRRYGTEGYVDTSEGLSIKVKTIQLWKENTQYTLVNDVCTTAPLVNGTEPTKCIPEDATFNSYFVEGKNEISLQQWTRSLHSADLNGTTIIAVSNKTCAPVGDDFAGSVDTGGQHVLMTSNGGFFNLTEGIKDPKKWFSIPRPCQHIVTNLEIIRNEVAYSLIHLLRKITFLSV